MRAFRPGVSRQFTRVLTHSKSYTRALSQEQQLELTIPPAPPGKRTVLYFYPVFDLFEVPVVMFGKPNEHGQPPREPRGRRRAGAAAGARSKRPAVSAAYRS